MSTRYQLILQQQKKNIKAYLILCLAVVLGTFALGYFKYSEYIVVKAAVIENQKYLEVLKKNVTDDKVAFETSKTDYDKLTEKIDISLKEVFPLTDNYTELTRSFDVLESKLNRSKDPFVISNIDYQDVQTSADGTYKYLPIRMTITSSNDNFTKFMQYIEESGSLSEGVRLMDVQSINLSLTEDDSADVKTINFSIKINAYFQGDK